MIYRLARPIALNRVIPKRFNRCYSEVTEQLKENATTEGVPESRHINEDTQVNQLLKTLYSRPMLENYDHVDLSPELEQELNREFNNAIKDFATEADLTQDIIKLVERSSVQGPKNSMGVKSEQQKQGNIRGIQNFPNVRRTESTDSYSSQELYLRRLFHAKNVTKLGAELSNVYKPHKDTLQPPSIQQTSINTLIAAGAHLGHSTALFRPSTQPYIYGIRDGIHIIDLDQTLVHLRRASKVVEAVGEKGGVILFVGTRTGQQRCLQKAAERAGAYYVHSRWVPGTLTNATQISGSWERVEVDMGGNPTDRVLSPSLKKTILKPDLVVLLNPVENRNAIAECIASKVPTIGIIDTDSEPSLVTYPVPANDDSLRSVELITGVLSQAAQKGKNMRLQNFNKYKAAQQQEENTDKFNSH